ncbi:MAG: hypothetical protein FWC76_08430 [Defluviitaleaceae bacterium]|nr:hypothetical protein [Defluviitaleaceae bacterium]
MRNEKSATLAALSAAIPHISFEHQKKLAIMVKMMEIKEICKFYDMAENAGKMAQNPQWRQNLINAVLPHLNEDRQKNLKTMVQVMEMQDVISSMENFKEMAEWK